MLNFNGESYNLDFLLQFQVLKQLLEALAKKQLEMDFLLYGSQKGKKSQNKFFSNQNTLIDNSGENIPNNDNSKNNIMEIMDLYGLKGGIKQNNDLIITLTKKIEDLENKNNDKMKIIESMESSEKEGKQKIQFFEERMDEMQKKIEIINKNTEDYLTLIDNNKNELMELINKNTKDIQKNTEAIEQLKNSINEYINEKINQMKYSLNEELTKKLDDLQDSIRKTTEKNIDLFNEKIDKINKTIKEHETKLFSFEDNHNKMYEDFNEKLSSLILFKNEQKSKNVKFSQDINTLKLMSENFNHNILRINELLETNTLQNLLNDLNSFSNKVVNLEEYKKTIDLINSHLKTLQSDNNQYRRYFEDILPLIGKITTAEDLKKLEQLLRELLEEQDSNAQKKYADKTELLKNIKNITNQIKMLMSKHDKNREPGDNCMLASKPITGYRCASCETYIGDLKNNTQYLPWNKFRIQDMVIKPYRVGNGFSYFLQNINLDNSPKNNNIEEVESIINLKNNYNTLNNSTCDKSKINKNILPSVSSNIIKNNQNGKNIIEIKPNFNTDDNNDINGENFNNILNEYINSDFVKIKNIRAKSEIQILAYNHCYQQNLYKYSWFLFLDVDEYLYIKNNRTLLNFLSDDIFLNCNSIFINYNEYGDSNLLKYDNRSIFKRFNKSRYIICGKSLTRGGIKNAKIDIHKPLYINNYCNSEGESEELYKDKIYSSKIVVNDAEIKHFITKSLEEFYQRLIKGWPCVKKFSKSYYEFVEGRIRYYFSLNKINQYKYNKLKPLITNENLLNELKFKLKK